MLILAKMVIFEYIVLSEMYYLKSFILYFCPAMCNEHTQTCTVNIPKLISSSDFFKLQTM